MLSLFAKKRLNQFQPRNESQTINIWQDLTVFCRYLIFIFKLDLSTRMSILVIKAPFNKKINFFD